MANEPISNLPAYGSSTPSNTADLLAIVNALITKKITPQELFTKYGLSTIPAGVNTPITTAMGIAQMLSNLQTQINNLGGGTGFAKMIYSLPSAILSIGAVGALQGAQNVITLPANTLANNGDKLRLKALLSVAFTNPSDTSTDTAIVIKLFSQTLLQADIATPALDQGHKIFVEVEITRESNTQVRYSAIANIRHRYNGVTHTDSDHACESGSFTVGAGLDISPTVFDLEWVTSLVGNITTMNILEENLEYIPKI